MIIENITYSIQCDIEECEEIFVDWDGFDQFLNIEEAEFQFEKDKKGWVSNPGEYEMSYFCPTHSKST